MDWIGLEDWIGGLDWRIGIDWESTNSRSDNRSMNDSISDTDLELYTANKEKGWGSNGTGHFLHDD